MLGRKKFFFTPENFLGQATLTRVSQEPANEKGFLLDPSKIANYRKVTKTRARLTGLAGGGVAGGETLCGWTGAAADKCLTFSSNFNKYSHHIVGKKKDFKYL